MKYSIYTILNSVYMKYFGKIFINSMYDKVNMSNVENVFIGDTGLTDTDKEYLSKFDKVKIIDTDINDNGDDFSVWSPKWHNSVTQKTRVLKDIIVKNKLPIVMIDADVLFLGDIESLIDMNYSVQVCFRNHPRRKNKHNMDYLGSYVSFNDEKSLDFLISWIKLIDEHGDVSYDGERLKAKETPCLCDIIKSYKTNGFIKIGNVDEDIVSSYDPPQQWWVGDNPRIKLVHFKGYGPYSFSNDIDQAFYGKIVSRGWGDYVQRYLD